ncbi:hypothetical protein GCM10010430_16450 [Kitasatospora cystarginea]|uniref:DivIVA domain-containing protein n=1 Tax=Kitasatospora cystarginea TaxID=58350 RepID=A0ABN3DM66_9ACTN
MDESRRPAKGDIFTPPVVVRPPTRGARPYRRVEIYGRLVGKAYDEADVSEFIRRAGVDDPDLDDPDLVGWRGGDRTVWSAEPAPHPGEAPTGPVGSASEETASERTASEETVSGDTAGGNTAPEEPATAPEPAE